MCKNFILIVSIALFGSTAVSAQKPLTAGAVLGAKEPDVVWNSKSMIAGDFTFDGIRDYAVRGIRGDVFVLGVVSGPLRIKSKQWILEFQENSGAQEGLCSVSDARIYAEPIDEQYKKSIAEFVISKYAKMIRNLPNGRSAIRISDNRCDSFHVFWDNFENQFTWWRV